MDRRKWVPVQLDASLDSQGSDSGSGGESDDGAGDEPRIGGVFRGVARPVATADPVDFGPVTRAAFDADVLAQLRREAEIEAHRSYRSQFSAWFKQVLRNLSRRPVHTCEWCEVRYGVGKVSTIEVNRNRFSSLRVMLFWPVDQLLQHPTLALQYAGSSPGRPTLVLFFPSIRSPSFLTWGLLVTCPVRKCRDILCDICLARSARKLCTMQ
jgi:hypothetical protein